MKKILLTAMNLLLAVNLVSCKEVINETDSQVEATIVETKYESDYSTTTFIMCGESMIPTTQYYPAEYHVVIDYNDVKYYLDNKNYYNICKDNKYKKVECTLHTKYYDDGSTKNDITSINKLIED